MSDQPTHRSTTLTNEQRDLVHEHIGLVAVHLRRHVADLRVPRRDREWDDLFQEGCLGLIKAAIAYRTESGIPFAAFALPRIHNAVSRALRRKFTTIQVPETRHSAGHGGFDPGVPASLGPRVHSLADREAGHLPDRRADPRGSEPGDDAETIGERLRGKYERAVRAAGRAIGMRSSTRGDRAELIDVLTEERLLVPHEESQRPLRQIARDTRSSYARVAQCHRQLQDGVRARLEADPEFRELDHRARNDPRGTAASIDVDLERALASACADEYVRRFRRAASSERMQLLGSLIEVSGTGVEDVLRRRVLALPMRSREKLLQPVCGR